MSTWLNSIASFKDKNVPDGVPQYAFWPQVKINGTWSSRATNLVNSINLIPTFTPFEQMVFNKLGLGILNYAKDMVQFFCIPPDNDDSGVNMALLGMLH